MQDLAYLILGMQRKRKVPQAFIQGNTVYSTFETSQITKF